MNFFTLFKGAVGGLPPESPTNREHHDSPMDQMDDSRNRPSPGLTDNQCGPSRNLYSYPETEEVRIFFLLNTLENSVITIVHLLFT